MRSVLVCLCLTLAACSSDPTPPVDSGLPPRDIATEIATWIDSGARCTPGTQGTCACLPGPMRAVYVCPASGVPPEPCPCAEDTDGAVRDAQAADLGVDAVTKDWPFEDRPPPMDVADVPRADVACSPGELLCAGRCVEPSTLNCGSCGNVCTTTLDHTRPACVGTGPDGGASCEWGCEPGWLNCNAMAADGCEYDVRGGGSCR